MLLQLFLEKSVIITRVLVIGGGPQSFIPPPNIKQILHPLLLNTKIYYTQGGNISRGRKPSKIFATKGVINLVFNSRWCNIRFIIHLHRISGEKNYDEEGKEMKKERKRRVTQTWLDLNSVPLGCEESV